MDNSVVECLFDCPACTRPWVKSEHCKTTNVDIEPQALGRWQRNRGSCWPCVSDFPWRRDGWVLICLPYKPMLGCRIVLCRQETALSTRLQ